MAIDSQYSPRSSYVAGAEHFSIDCIGNHADFGRINAMFDGHRLKRLGNAHDARAALEGIQEVFGTAGFLQNTPLQTPHGNENRLAVFLPGADAAGPCRVAKMGIEYVHGPFRFQAAQVPDDGSLDPVAVQSSPDTGNVKHPVVPSRRPLWFDLAVVDGRHGS